MLLIALGLIMVLSTSSAVALDSGGRRTPVQEASIGVAVGLPLMWAAARSSPTLFRAAAYPLIGISSWA